MCRSRRSKAKKEFSKIILICVAIVALLVIVFACVMIALTRDLSPLSYLIPAVFAELATGTAFYYSKAKAENEIKIAKSMERKDNE